MDGNGRWAQNRGLLRSEGHRAGADSVKVVIRCCLQHKIPVLSVFAFGSDNWSRPAKEVDFLMQLFVEALKNEVQELNTLGVRLRFTGDRAALSKKLCQHMEEAERQTRQNDQLILNIVVNYGGKWDLVQASKILAKKVFEGELKVDEINETLFAQYLSTHDLPDPDLFIRSSGEQRISNFFLWQLAYTELYFATVHWPDFDALEFQKALDSFSARERRYGKTSQQIQEVSNV